MIDREVLRQCLEALESIQRNDETTHHHHSPRKWDGKTPREAGMEATRWAEPREIAYAFAKRIERHFAEAETDDTTVEPEQVKLLGKYLEFHGAIHEDECPCDDTCDCSGKPMNDAVNHIYRVLAALSEGGRR